MQIAQTSSKTYNYVLFVMIYGSLLVCHYISSLRLCIIYAYCDFNTCTFRYTFSPNTNCFFACKWLNVVIEFAASRRLMSHPMVSCANAA
jgi:hypothetical protein